MVTKQAPTGLDEIITGILRNRQAIASAFAEMGDRLKQVREQQLYAEAGFKTFAAFLAEPPLGLSSAEAERYITLFEDSQLRQLFPLGIEVVMELAKMPPEERTAFLSQDIDLGEITPRQAKKAVQEATRQHKIKCDRCGRWVEQAKEIDGKFYGSSGQDCCYDREMEDRRVLAEGQIPAPQMDRVLDSLKTTVTSDQSELPVNNWLPQSLFNLYGQLLQQSDEETSNPEALSEEARTLDRLIRLFRARLKETRERLKTMNAE